MTFSYDNTLDTERDQVRFRIGDTNSAASAQERIEDEEIDATIAAQSNLSEAMAQCAEALAAKFFRHATTKQLASARVSYEKRVDYLLSLAERLRSGIEAVAATDIVITGTTNTELLVDSTNTDVVQSAFRRGQFENPDADVSADEEEVA